MIRLLFYLSESKMENIIQEMRLFYKDNTFFKVFESASAKLDVKLFSAEAKIRNQNNETKSSDIYLGMLDTITSYLKKQKKLHVFTPKTKKLNLMHAYKINATLNFYENFSFGYIKNQPDDLSIFDLHTESLTFPQIKVDCTNKYIHSFLYGKTGGGKSTIIRWTNEYTKDIDTSSVPIIDDYFLGGNSITRRLINYAKSQSNDKPVNTTLVVQSLVFITKINNSENIVYGSPLYITF